MREYLTLNNESCSALVLECEALKIVSESEIILNKVVFILPLRNGRVLKVPGINVIKPINIQKYSRGIHLHFIERNMKCLDSNTDTNIS